MKKKIISVTLALLMVNSFVRASEESEMVDEAEAAEEVSLPSGATEPRAVENNASSRGNTADVRFTMAVGYNVADKAKFNNIAVSQGASSGTGSYEASIDAAAYISAGIMTAPIDSWGFNANMLYEFKRNINSEKVSGNFGTSIYNYTDKPSIQMTVIEGNALYRWKNFYLPFGLNYSIPIFKTTSNSSASADVKGAVGAQIGVGYFVNDSFHFSLYSKAYGARGTLTYPTTPQLSVDLGIGHVAGLSFQMNYLF